MKTIKLANIELEKFLREKRVYQKFIKNATMKKTNGSRKEWIQINKNLTINSTFIFAATREGQSFWDYINDEFYKTTIK